MKRNIIYITLVAITVILATSCKRDISYVASYQYPDNTGTAYLRIVHAAPYFRLLYNQPDSFNVYINNAKINFQFLTFGSLFPATLTNGYAAIPAGLEQIRLSVNGIVNVDSLTIATFTKTLTAGNYYSFILTDSLKSPNPAMQMFVQDAVPVVLPGYYNLRVINAAYEDSVTTTTGNDTLDVWSYARNGLVATKLVPGSITSFSTLGTNIAVPDTFYVTRLPPAKPTGPATPLANRIVLAKLAVTPISRNYTLLIKGDNSQTTGRTARGLALYAQ